MKRLPVIYYLAVSVAFITAAVYLSSLRNGFVEFDDPFYVLDNLNLRTLNLNTLKWAFFDFYASNWHPLTWLSHALDYAFWGLNPTGHHLTNLLLHAANAFLVVLLIFKLMETARDSAPGAQANYFRPQAILITAGVTGLLFGLHPLHVESVAWISERKDLLCGLFFLLSIFCYRDYACSRRSDMQDKQATLFRVKKYALALGFFALALLSKPMAVTLPLVLLILDWYPLERLQTRSAFLYACFEKIPFFVLSAASSVLTVLAQQGGGAMPLEATPLPVRLLVAVRALVLYLGKMVWPADLIPYYAYPPNVSLSSPEYILFIAVILAVTVFCVSVVRKRKLWTATWSYYIVTLVPVIGIVQVGGQSMADRYTYLPGLGPFFLAGIAAAAVWSKGSEIKRFRTGVQGSLAILALVVLVVLARGTLKQITVWNNGLDLWTYIIEKNDPAPPLVYYNRGMYYFKSGQLERALADDNKAIALDPTYYEAYANRGLIYNKMNLPDRAVTDLDKAITLNPSYYQAYYNRGIAYLKKHQFDRAIADFTKTLDLQPSLLSAYNNRGTAFFIAGQLDKAMADFDKIISTDPANNQAHYNRGLTLQRMGRSAEAAREFETARTLQ